MNNKGLAISGILYSIFILFLMLLFAILGVLGSRKVILDKTKKEIFETLNNENKDEVYHFAFTGSPQELTIINSGEYLIEAWGASGGGTSEVTKGESLGGKGAYVSGIISLEKNQKLYIYVGEGGMDATLTNLSNLSLYSSKWNGGGAGAKDTNESELTGEHGFSGGGATDVRLINGSWNNIESLRSRILVAGAGAGGGWSGNGASDQYYANGGGHSGGLSGGVPINSTSYKIGTQISGYSFGTGGNGIFGSNGNNNGTSGGGGGYYGGSQGLSFSKLNARGSGGSSYISGHLGSVAVTSSSTTSPKTGCTDGTTDITCSYHYSGLIFRDTVMIDGATGMLSPTGDSEIGHTGNGYVIITKIN